MHGKIPRLPEIRFKFRAVPFAHALYSSRGKYIDQFFIPRDLSEQRYAPLRIPYSFISFRQFFYSMLEFAVPDNEVPVAQVRYCVRPRQIILKHYEVVRAKVPDILIHIGEQYIGAYCNDPVIIIHKTLQLVEIVMRTVGSCSIDAVDPPLAAVIQMVLHSCLHNVLVVGAVIGEHQKFHIFLSVRIL